MKGEIWCVFFSKEQVMKKMGRYKRTYDARKRQCEGKGRLLEVHLHFKINAEILGCCKAFPPAFSFAKSRIFCSGPRSDIFSHEHVCMRCWYAKI